MRGAGMTVIRHEGQMQVTCDACPATYRRTYEASDFAIMMDDITEDGWKKIRKAGDWTHQCPDCARFSDRRLL